MSEAILSELIALEESNRDAWFNRDLQALQDLLADDFMEIDDSGRMSKDDLLGGLFPKLTLITYDMEDFEAVIADADTATLTYRVFEKATVEDDEFEGDFTVAATFTKRDGRWRLLLWQSTPFEG
jgi:hypothetical protein